MDGGFEVLLKNLFTVSIFLSMDGVSIINFYFLVGMRNADPGDGFNPQT